MRELITSNAPDLIGTQEGLHAQLGDLASDLPDYNWTGVRRDDGKNQGRVLASVWIAGRGRALATITYCQTPGNSWPGRL